MAFDFWSNTASVATCTASALKIWGSGEKHLRPMYPLYLLFRTESKPLSFFFYPPPNHYSAKTEEIQFKLSESDRCFGG